MDVCTTAVVHWDQLSPILVCELFNRLYRGYSPLRCKGINPCTVELMFLLRNLLRFVAASRLK